MFFSAEIFTTDAVHGVMFGKTSSLCGSTVICHFATSSHVSAFGGVTVIKVSRTFLSFFSFASLLQVSVKGVKGPKYKAPAAVL